MARTVSEASDVRVCTPSITARSEHSRIRQWRNEKKGAPPLRCTYVLEGPRNGRAGVAATRGSIRVRVSPHNSRALSNR